MQQRRLLTRKQASEYLGICVSELDKLVAKKLIPVVRFCRKPLFRVEDLEDFIKKHLEGVVNEGEKN